MHTLVLSDLHLGARNAQPDILCQFFDSDTVRRADQVVLNGDVVDHLNFEDFRRCEWQVLKRLTSLARQDRLVLVRGNHDVPRRGSEPGCQSRYLLAGILETAIHEEITLRIGSRRLLVQHGDRFDQTLNMTKLGYFAEDIYRHIQCWHRPTSRWLKRQSKTFLGVEEAVKRKAMIEASRRGFDGIILGHTHAATLDEEANGTWYLNSGSWVDEECCYLSVRDEVVELRTWPACQSLAIARSEPDFEQDYRLMSACA